MLTHQTIIQSTVINHSQQYKKTLHIQATTYEYKYIQNKIKSGQWLVLKIRFKIIF